MDTNTNHTNVEANANSLDTFQLSSASLDRHVPVATPSMSVEDKNQKPKKTYRQNNKVHKVSLDLDAGAKRVKCQLTTSDGKTTFKSFPSVAKVIADDVPIKSAGCFTLGKTNYVVGRGIDRVNGQLIQASANNKLTHLDVWLTGALTHYVRFLEDCISSRRRKTEPVRLEIKLRLITLSVIKRKELDKQLKSCRTFVYNDVDIEVNVSDVSFVDEAEGAVRHLSTLDLPDGELHLIDLGGGTFTHSTYEAYDGILVNISRTPISGAGMVAIVNQTFKALTRTDRGAASATYRDIQEALELSAVDDDGQWTVPLRINGKVVDISQEVAGAMSEWLGENSVLQKQMDVIAQRVYRGEPVYCTGGGFATAVVADWIRTYLSQDNSNLSFTVLPNPADINVKGLVQS